MPNTTKALQKAKGRSSSDQSPLTRNTRRSQLRLFALPGGLSCFSLQKNNKRAPTDLANPKTKSQIPPKKLPQNQQKPKSGVIGVSKELANIACRFRAYSSNSVSTAATAKDLSTSKLRHRIPSFGAVAGGEAPVVLPLLGLTRLGGFLALN